MNEKNIKSRTILNNLFILSIAFKAKPQSVIMEFVIKSIMYSQGFFYLLLVNILVNSLQDNKNFMYLFSIIAFGTIIFLFLKFLNNWYYENIKIFNDVDLYEKINIMLFKKAIEADLNCYEDPSYYNNYTKANQEANIRISSVINNLSNIVGGIIVSICYLLKLISIDALSIVIIILPIIATTQMGKKLNKCEYNLYQDNILSVRKKEYVKRTVYLRSYAKELRIYFIFNVLEDIFKDAFTTIIFNIKKYSFRLMFFRLFQRLLAGSIPTIIFLGYKTIQFLQSPFEIGSFAVIFFGFLSFSSAIENLLGETVKFQDNSLYIDNFKVFLDYKPTINNSNNAVDPPKEIEQILFNNVSFAYPNSTKMILKNINICISKGQKVSLVGHNGAGKSTIIKLLLRLYDPTEGEILLNGRNIKEYNIYQYRELFGSIMQDFNIYGMSIADNILMKKTDEFDINTVNFALQESGLYDDIVKFSNGINSILTKEFEDNGQILSGGQSQKIALARAFASNSKILILDEPSSALDPIAENLIWENIIKLSNSKIAFFISHRLSASKLAGSIYVIDNGSVIENGTHDQLINLKGAYFKMYSVQAENYKKMKTGVSK